VEGLLGWMDVLVKLNPATYGVTAVRQPMPGGIIQFSVEH